MINKITNIYNEEEIHFLLKNWPYYVLTEIKANYVHKLTSEEKWENITATTFRNAEGDFFHLVCILEGVNKRGWLERQIHLELYIEMSKNSSYVNTEIIFAWLKNNFIPRKTQGTCVFCLDRHYKSYESCYTPWINTSK